MPNYYLVKESHLSVLPRARAQLGFLDFLRELQDETFAFTPYESIRVDGLEDVLLAARPDYQRVAYDIRRILQRSASDLQSKLAADVQIVFRNDLVPGDTLWVEHPTDPRLPVHLIFGSPPAEEIGGHPVYRVGFNLTSP
jgi:hypothetical protein